MLGSFRKCPIMLQMHNGMNMINTAQPLFQYRYEVQIFPQERGSSILESYSNSMVGQRERWTNGLRLYLQ